jgi:hypothetical protein
VTAAGLEALGEDGFEAGYQRGRRIPREEMLARALRETEPISGLR